MKVVMKMKKDLKQTIAQGLNLPPETFTSLPLGTFRGKEELSIENHRGILAYSGDMIRIALHRGSVMVQGRDLIIASMGKDRLVIRGVLRLIELE